MGISSLLQSTNNILPCAGLISSTPHFLIFSRRYGLTLGGFLPSESRLPAVSSFPSLVCPPETAFHLPLLKFKNFFRRWFSRPFGVEPVQIVEESLFFPVVDETDMLLVIIIFSHDPIQGAFIRCFVPFEVKYEFQTQPAFFILRLFFRITQNYGNQGKTQDIARRCEFIFHLRNVI
jgi:hypothetical protein